MTTEAHDLPRIIRFYRMLWRIWKYRRFRRFLDIVKPNLSDHLLDIGGYPFNWYSRGNVIGRVDVLNLDLSPVFDPPAGSPEIRAISGDARTLPFPAQSYDILFSNSVIEHVGTFDDQTAFAREALRVGKRLWIQTPAKECPVEPHYLGLFIHWFPRSWHLRLARMFSVVGLTRPSDLEALASSTRLLTKWEMRELFPGCEIWTERIFWIFPKSHVAIRSNQLDLPA
jgi:hypothetical protein